MVKDVRMSEMFERIVLVALACILIAGFIWFRNDEPAPVGPCVQVAGTTDENPVFYRQGDPATYSYPDCSAESRITI
jgi:hypothetical protein